MTDDAVTWLIAGWQVATAIGITGFWLTWFRRRHEDAWLPPGYVEHERVFVFPDAVCAVLLVVSAVLLVAEEPFGGSLALVAAGMLVFLGVIDAAYSVRQGLFARERGGVGNLAIVVAVLALAAVLVVRYA